MSHLHLDVHFCIYEKMFETDSYTEEQVLHCLKQQLQ